MEDIPVNDWCGRVVIDAPCSGRTQACLITIDHITEQSISYIQHNRCLPWIENLKSVVHKLDFPL